MNKRFITAGVNNKIGLPLQLLIWGLSTSLPCQADYLQVFRLKQGIEKGKTVQIVKQSQEVPEYERSFSFFCDTAVNEKLFLIRDGVDADEIETLLLAGDY